MDVPIKRLARLDQGKKMSTNVQYTMEKIMKEKK